jgi:DNA sulfur modification protein DndB
MKIPAIRAKIGTLTYYITVLTFKQVSEYVEKVDDQLHTSIGLRDMIQRSITDNYIKIKEYIQKQPEMFFNSLVLGVYDGMPKWIEVELSYGDEEYFNLGFLDFPGNEKIFPIDGQHRVEGIKAALLEDNNLKDNKIGAIFIGHSKSKEGMEKSRRLFTTLNRYAKPVTEDDIIALDEDDSVAIATRFLLENFKLFEGKRITKSKNKAISEKDKDSITSIITLYQCNKELLKLFRLHRKHTEPNSKRDNKSISDYLKFRPNEIEIKLFNDYLVDFWSLFQEKMDSITIFMQTPEAEEPANQFRNKSNGGNLLFRPVGLFPFLQAVIEIKKRFGISFEDIFSRFSKANFTLDVLPWKNVLWNPTEKTMLMGNNVLVKLLLLYIYDDSILTMRELEALAQKYADRIGYEGVDLNNALNDIPELD